MNPAKRKQIGSLADSVRGALGVETPIAYEELVDAVARLGGAVREGNTFRLKHEATIRKTEGGRFEIVIDNWKPVTRMLFSLAHEIGHLFVHMGFGSARWNRESDYVESYARSGYDEEEYEANEFAAALLMPAAQFRALNRAGKSKVEIADRFGVSVDAAETRGKWLGVYKW